MILIIIYKLCILNLVIILHIELLIKEIRKEKGITLEQLSKMTGVSTSHINDIENNKKEPSLSIAIMLAKALKVNITEIYRVKN